MFFKDIMIFTHPALIQQEAEAVEDTRGRPIIGTDIKHFTDYRYRPF